MEISHKQNNVWILNSFPYGVWKDRDVTFEQFNDIDRYENDLHVKLKEFICLECTSARVISARLIRVEQEYKTLGFLRQGGTMKGKFAKRKIFTVFNSDSIMYQYHLFAVHKDKTIHKWLDYDLYLTIIDDYITLFNIALMVDINRDIEEMINLCLHLTEEKVY